MVAAYETALGLSAFHLGAAVRGLRRSFEPGAAHVETASAPPRELHEELDLLFERVDGDCAHGADWLALTDYLAHHAQIYLRPRSWEQLAESLMSQLARSVAPAYIRASRRFAPWCATRSPSVTS